jgi:GNAT superfamily N-acetyltransferase
MNGPATKGYEQMNALELERIYIVKSASGRGFGREAMEFCFDFAKQRNKQVIWLKCMDSSPAHYFYERLGFVQCGGFDLDFYETCI